MGWSYLNPKLISANPSVQPSNSLIRCLMSPGCCWVSQEGC